MILGLPPELAEMMGSMRGGHEERNRFKADATFLPAWEAMLSTETDLINLLMYARMINSSDEDGADAMPFVDAVADRYFALLPTASKGSLMKDVSLLLGEFKLRSANHQFIRLMAERLEVMPISIAFYLHAAVDGDDFGGRAAKDAIFNRVPEDLQVAFDLYVQALA